MSSTISRLVKNILSRMGKTPSGAVAPQTQSQPPTLNSNLPPTPASAPIQLTESGQQISDKSQTLSKLSDRADPPPPPLSQPYPAQSDPVPAPSRSERRSFVVKPRLKSIKPHVPMIRFRKGGLSPMAHGTANDSSGEDSLGMARVAQVSLEWWEIPEQYRRRALDDYECDVINMGGRDKPFE